MGVSSCEKGETMTHKFDVERIQRLDSEERKKILRIDVFLELIDPYLCNTEISYVDLGCGVGYFTLPVARRLKETGKVYAVDIQKGMLEELERRASNEGLTNVQTILSEENHIPLPDSLAHIANMGNLFHELQDPKVHLEEVKRILKPEGVLILIDWERMEAPIGPPIDRKISSEDAIESLKEAGFSEIQKKDLFDFNYCILAINRHGST